MANLGKLEPVNVRDIWQNEEDDFTPWLASRKGLRLLSEWVGLPLEDGRAEVQVGQFRADIVCRDISDPDRPATVVIENQLEPSDHDHLGKLLAYASGTQADSGIWIATDFAPEHLDAVRAWNKPADRPVDLYCVQLSGWSIDGSRPIATFNVLVRPDSSKSRVMHLASSASHAGVLDQFWSRFQEKMATDGPGWKTRHVWDETYRSYEIGHPGACLSVVRDIARSRARLYIFRGYRWMFDELKRDQTAINSELGGRVRWRASAAKPNKRCSIDLGRPAHLYDRSKWDEEIEWMIDKLQLLDRVFRERLKALPANEPTKSRAGTRSRRSRSRQSD